MSDYYLAVPSYRRAESFGKKTLRFLRASGAPDPTVYVADQQDYDAYKALYPELDIRVAVKGMCAVRNFIQEEQPLGKKILFMDDDITEIYRLDFQSEKAKKIKVRDFNALVRIGFTCAEKAGTTMWGVYPTDNTLGLKPYLRRNLCYLVGAFYGVINARVQVEYDYAEDYERSIKYWNKEGRLCRLEFIGIQTRYYKNEGGLQDTRNEILNTEHKRCLADQYPNLCKVIKKKTRTELYFRRFPSYMIDVREDSEITSDNTNYN